MASVHPEMALFRKSSVNLKGWLFPPGERDAQPLDFLDLAKKNISELETAPALSIVNGRALMRKVIHGCAGKVGRGRSLEIKI